MLEYNKIHNLECMHGMAQMSDESIDCVVTSPPYWKLRDYGTTKWEGGDPNCDHTMPRSTNRHRPGDKSTTNRGSNPITWQTCGRCGAKRVDDQIGLEQTPEEYVAKMVEVFREVRRVLKKEGTLWIVLGDTYASGKGTCYNPGGGKKSLCKERKQAGVVPLQRGNKSTLALSKLKPKDLVGIPWRVALALQQDGWWLRSDIIWHKTNVLPESVTDRPTKSHEYIFLLTKSPKYYYNNDAIREKTGNEHDPEAYEKLKDGDYYDKSRSLTTGRRWKSDIPSRHRRITHPLGRNKRTIWVTSCGNRTPGHYATYPEELITPCILAGCPPGGVVMDPFAGSGTTLVAAKRNGRQGIGYDLNPDYVKTATKRLNDVPVYKKMGEFT